MLTFEQLVTLLALKMGIAASSIEKVVLAQQLAAINDVDLIEKDDKLLLVVDKSQVREALGLSQEQAIEIV
jgi:hypothetical protein